MIEALWWCDIRLVSWVEREIGKLLKVSLMIDRLPLSIPYEILMIYLVGQVRRPTIDTYTRSTIPKDGDNFHIDRWRRSSETLKNAAPIFSAGDRFEYRGLGHHDDERANIWWPGACRSLGLARRTLLRSWGPVLETGLWEPMQMRSPKGGGVESVIYSVAVSHGTG